METFIQDIRCGVRMLARSPGFCAVAILMLAVGIGANTAIFGLLDQTLHYQVAQFRDFDRLYIVMLHSLKVANASGRYADYLHLKDHADVFEGLAAHTPVSLLLSGQDKPERVYGQEVSLNLFSMMGIAPILGRDFLPEDTESVTLVSHQFWRTHLAYDPSVLGRALTLNGKSHTVIGVLPADLQFPTGHIFMPFSQEYRGISQRLVAINPINMIGKVKSQIPFDQVRAGIDSYTRNLEQELSLSPGSLFIFMWHPFEGMSKTSKEVFLLLQCAVGLVLMLACANLANLLVARAMARQREMATRAALGARRFRLLRQLLTEGLILTGLGTVFGFLLAVCGSRVLVKVLLQYYPEALNYLEFNSPFNVRVLGFTLVVSGLTGILFSLVPAMRASQVDLNQALKEASASASGLGRFEGRSVVVILQVALALGVLIAASLLIKARTLIHGIYTGPDADKVMVMTLSPNKDRYVGEIQMKAFYEQILERVTAVPGVESVGLTAGHMPYTDGYSQVADFAIEGLPPGSLVQQARCAVVTPGYLRTLQIPLRRGRYFTEQDARDGNPVVIINEGLVRAAKATQIDPIGRSLKVTYRFLENGKAAERTQLCTILGVAADVKRRG